MIPRDPLLTSSTMSTSPTSPLDRLFAGINVDQLIAEEQEHETSGSAPTPPILGKRISPSTDHDPSDSNDEDEREPSAPRGESPSRSSSVVRPNSGSLQVDQATRRMAKRLKLSNEDICLVEKFTQASLANPPLG